MGQFPEHDQESDAVTPFAPARLREWRLTLDAELAADIADAEAAVRNLDAVMVGDRAAPGVARFLALEDAIGSCQIEDITVDRDGLVEALVAATRGHGPAGAAASMLATFHATQAVPHVFDPSREVTVAVLHQLHRLVTGGNGQLTPGQLRTVQSWIGRNPYAPAGAAYIPPAPETLESLLDDLVGYISDDRHSPLVQAAIAHAQFETIHPYVDGNGRVGRALIHGILHRRQLATAGVVPFSVELASIGSSYGDLLTRYRTANRDDLARSGAVDPWIDGLAQATRRACTAAHERIERLSELGRQWGERLGAVRANSTLGVLLAHLPGHPVITPKIAGEVTGRSTARATDAINRLTDAGILQLHNPTVRRNRIHVAHDVIDLLMPP